ncbi:MAG: Na+/H+ antiporter NhaC family protein [Schwartzia sp.]|nr:Na+/H+ antiporter NhaC family protein [Schwartzia sp. (in: firmicutes)]
MAQTVWALFPPILTIALALATKEVYMSLLIGIFSGAMLLTDFNIVDSILTMFQVMEEKVGGNVNILVFLVMLGIIVAAISRSGATAAYGEWASRQIHGKKSALLLTALLGVVIFIDDYFNCLTVGTVMRPITDKFKVSRAKVAYIIDATAAPVCILAPVSSWAAAVGSSLPEGSSIDGFGLFLQTIPINLYAILTMLFMLFIALTGRDFATMGKVVRENNKHFKISEEYKEEETEEAKKGNGKIIDLMLPILVLIAACVYGMLYTGGINEGKTIADAFADCDSAKSLALGSFIAFVFMGLLYLPRRVISFDSFCECFGMGFKAMVPAIFILCLAWTMSGIVSEKYLNLGGYVGNLVGDNASLGLFLPAIFFIVAAFLAFATGTSWGTFGILIPIAVAVVGIENYNGLVLAVAAVLSGAVAGDHASPISDTTILASAGAQCHHIDHVSTQLPYVLLVVMCSFVGYIVDGFTNNGFAGLAVGIVMLAIVCLFIRAKVPAVEIDNPQD